MRHCIFSSLGLRTGYSLKQSAWHQSQNTSRLQAPKPLDCLPTTETITYAVHDSREKSPMIAARRLSSEVPRERKERYRRVYHGYNWRHCGLSRMRHLRCDYTLAGDDTGEAGEDGSHLWTRVGLRKRCRIGGYWYGPSNLYMVNSERSRRISYTAI